MEEAGSTEGQSTYEEETLSVRIETAFADILYPGDDRLVPAPYENHWEGGEIARAFAGQHWKTVSLGVLSTNLASLSYLTPEAFRYYLPAYLLASLRRLSAAEAETGAANIPGSLVYHLTPPKQEGLRLDDFRSRTSGLTLEQKTVIRDFLRWLDLRGREWERKYLPEHAQREVEEDEGEIALKEYWENIR